ncbi:MAG: lytic transglycosylase domain-containing protein [Solirubrobacteraceae bacterium]|nr:lytic transglycosylase domain-containing protein [Patulibacter sp.]
MSLDSAAAVGGDIASRIAQIQQMAQQLGLDTGASSTGFQSALDSASSTSGATNVSSVSTPVSGTPYASEINAAAQKYGIDPSLLAGLVKQESGFNPNATSAVGAKGLTQLMPATAKSLGVTDPTDPAQSLDGGAHYLKEQLDRFGGDVTKAVAAYNAGPGAVQRYGGVPPYAETQNYVKNVLANRDAYAKTAAANGTLSTTATTGTAAAGSTAATVSALSNLTGVSSTGGVTTSSMTNPYSSSLSALSTDDSDNSSNLSLSSSSSSTGSGTSSSLGYPTT